MSGFKSKCCVVLISFFSRFQSLVVGANMNAVFYLPQILHDS